MSSVVSLLNHSNLQRLISSCAHSFAGNWQLPFLNQQKGENDHRKYFKIDHPKRILLDLLFRKSLMVRKENKKSQKLCLYWKKMFKLSSVSISISIFFFFFWKWYRIIQILTILIYGTILIKLKPCFNSNNIKQEKWIYFFLFFYFVTERTCGIGCNHLYPQHAFFCRNKKKVIIILLLLEALLPNM